MPSILRPLANLPHPFEFGVANKNSTKINRVGLGSTIHDHESFLEFVSKNPLTLSIMAERYRHMLKTSPEDIIIVDFESLPIFQKGMRIVPTEVTFRDGNGKVILSAVIKDNGVNNTQFEEKIKRLGYTDQRCIASCRRIRGMPNRDLRAPSMTPKQILQKLRDYGFNRSSVLIIEYSIGYYDRHCFEDVIIQAGVSPDDFLPPLSQFWPVCSDFMRCLPGLGTSYRLGNVARLMTPAILNGLQLHTSRADTFVLHQILRHWVNVYGAGAPGASVR
ncbi:hypothetical protein EDD37DRAFT_362600 [Exophiala viscosa]|uniref:uncharacterized protein n=1 Tax=Exophiala viscosa TaxID=2486360 RepID=UPI0021A1F518|nr:hypothetical protein EDD37DRAFT_362600 [Exophiala viscosa]